MHKIQNYIIFSFVFVQILFKRTSSDSNYAYEITDRVSTECLNRTKIDLDKSLREFSVCRSVALYNMQRVFIDCKVENVMTELCKRDALKYCFIGFENKVKDCLLEEIQAEFIDDPVKSLSQGLDFICKDDGYGVKILANEETKQCLNSAKEKIYECNSKYGNIHIKWFTREFRDDVLCFTRGKWGTCILNSLDKCNDDIQDLVHGLLVAMIHSTPCKELVSKEIPQLSSSNQIASSKLIFALPIYMLLIRNN